MNEGNRYRIGEWIFAAADNALCRGGERRRLEERAARTLELLCARRGETVPHEEIVAAVWKGRAQSPNSLAIVIGQLRRALDDDARRPRFIETVAKRGYRLAAAEDQPGPAAGVGRRRWPAVAAAALLLLALAATGLLTLARDPPPIAFAEVANATGDRRFDPLARATGDLIVAELGRRGFGVRGDERGGAPLRLTARLILWNGEPTVSLRATAPDGAVRWSAMARGPEGAIARNVEQALSEFAARTS